MSSNAAGYAAIDDMVARLRGLPEAFRAAAPELAKAVKSEADKAIAEGHSLDGKAWAPKKDGGRPLVNAAKAVRVYVSGLLITLELSGVEVFHNYGTARLPERPIFPTQDGMPMKLGQAIRAGAVKVWDKQMRRA